jgi:hypothetical protein
MEGTHVGALKVQKLDLLGLVILIGVDLDGVSGVLLPVRGRQRRQ